MKFNAPYLILIGGEKDPTYAKTGYGLVPVSYTHLTLPTNREV